MASKQSLSSGSISVIVPAAAADGKGVRGLSAAVQRGEGEESLGLCSQPV